MLHTLLPIRGIAQCQSSSARTSNLLFQLLFIFAIVSGVPFKAISQTGNFVSSGIVYTFSGTQSTQYTYDCNFPPCAIPFQLNTYSLSGGAINTNGNYNTITGFSAGISNTGSGNTFMGSSAGNKNTSGGNNVFIGQSSGYSNTTGGSNSFLGNYAGYANTGSSNTFLGAWAGRSNTSAGYNVFVGANSGYTNTTGSFNTFSGYNSGYANTTGYSNTADGYQALKSNTTGYWNTSVGNNAMFTNSSGYGNSALGTNALYYNTTGSQNTASGAFALQSNTTGAANTADGYNSSYYTTTGSFNTANGWEALYHNTTGQSNTSVGYASLFSNSNGLNNTACGLRALYSNTSGYYNTAIGWQAMYSNTTGFSNTELGYATDVNSGGYSNATAIGSQATGTASNQVRIGNSSVTSIGGYVNWSNISDGRYKRDVQENVPGLEFIDMLHPVTYHLDIDGINKFLRPDGIKDAQGKVMAETPEEEEGIQQKKQTLYSGFVAQDVDAAAKKIGFVFSGVDAPKNDKDLYGLRYADFVVPLVKAVQELDVKNQELEARIEKLEAMLNIAFDTSNNGAQKVTINGNEEGYLLQNVPNPFTGKTSIHYFVPESASSAQIVWRNQNGGVLKTEQIAKGNGAIEMDANQLPSAEYSYSLIIDGKVIVTRLMSLQK